MPAPMMVTEKSCAALGGSPCQSSPRAHGFSASSSDQSSNSSALGARPTVSVMLVASRSCGPGSVSAAPLSR